MPIRSAAILLTVALAVASPAQTNVQLAEAQRAAFGRPGGTTYRIANENVSFQGGRLLSTRFGPVLVAEGKVRDFGHGSPGRIGAFYIRRTPTGFARGRDFPSAVVGGSMGGIGEWSVSNRFGPNPVIFAEGGFFNMGSGCSTTQLVELTPTGPVPLVSFHSGASHNGSDRQRAADTQGRIANIVPGRSFDVVFTGSRPGRDRYVRAGGRYRLAGGRPHIPAC